MELKQRVEKIIEHLNDGLYEREEHVAVLLLAALSGNNAFLLGPPGTAKSLLARRLSSVFQAENGEKHYFEYLMNRFSTPEDIFGPVSIKALKEDKYKRKTDGFLPGAKVAFLDEIWKSSAAILNTLLTILNEKKFRNGDILESVPLQFVVTASNETPPTGQGLEALYDRFIVRLYSPPIASYEHFTKFIAGDMSERQIDKNLMIKKEELERWHAKIKAVKIPEEIMEMIGAIRHKLEKDMKKLEVYVSDRRWLKAISLMKAGAFFCGRESVNIVDVLLLRHCLWTTEKNRESVMKVTENVVKESGLMSQLKSDELMAKKDQLEKEIKKELFYSNEVHKTQKIRGQEFFCIWVNYYNVYDTLQDYSENLYIPNNKIKTNGSFYPVNGGGSEIRAVICDFKGGETCHLIGSMEHGRKYAFIIDNKNLQPLNEITFTPKILHNKGKRKEDVHEAMLKYFIEGIDKIIEEYDLLILEIDEEKEKFEADINTPFVTDETKEIAKEAIQKQYDDFIRQLEDCNRIRDLIYEE